MKHWATASWSLKQAVLQSSLMAEPFLPLLKKGQPVTFLGLTGWPRLGIMTATKQRDAEAAFLQQGQS